MSTFRMSRCHRVPRLPKLMHHRVRMLPSAWCLMCLRCPSHGASVHHVSVSMCHRAPMLPTVCQGRLLHDSPMHPCWPTLMAIVRTSLLPILPISCAHCVQSCQCAQNVPIVCQSFRSQDVPLLQKLPMSRCLYRPSCPCQCTPSVPNFLTAWCLCRLSCTCL